MDLQQAIRFHARTLGERSQVAVTVLECAAVPLLPARVKEQCFLAVREALSNAIRHGGATRVEIGFRVRGGYSLTITIVDDGVGFDPRQILLCSEGHGLAMIDERIQGVGGDTEILSAPGEGATVNLRVPLDTTEADA